MYIVTGKIKEGEVEPMVGLVLVSHGGFGSALMRSASLIAGEYENVVTLSLEKNDNAEELHQKILAGIEEADKGDGVMIFTDVMGGTPSNLSTLVARKHQLFCLTGVNLPMILEFVMSAADGISLEELADRCYEAATEGIKITNKV